MTDEDDEHYRNINICRFFEKEAFSHKVRDQCHLNSEYRGPAHGICNVNVTQKRSNFIPFVFHNFSNYDCHLCFKKLVDNENDKIKIDIIPNTIKQKISVTCGFTKFVDSYRFVSSSSDSIVKTLVDNCHKTLKRLKEEFVDYDEILKIVIEIGEENRTIQDLNKDYPDKIENIKEALLNYKSENDPKTLKTEFPDDKWK